MSVINLGLLPAVTSVAGTPGQILVNGQYAATNGAVVISLDITGGFETTINGLTGVITLAGNNGNTVSVSGQTLWISGASGYNDAIYATIANLNGMGVNLSGTIASTGQQAWTAANNNGRNLSGNLTATGLQITLASGTLSAAIALTGQQAWTAANNNGVNLSGNLASTGQQAWNTANNNGINLSGNLTQSGILLLPRANVIPVTGNFIITGNVFNTVAYVWSGLSTMWTGTLAAAVSLSGCQMLIKNISTGASLLISGTVDYAPSTVLLPRAAMRLLSDNASWLII